MAYGDFKDLNRRTASKYKILCDKAFNIAKSPKYDGYQKGLASIVYKFFVPLCRWCCYVCMVRDFSYAK